MRGLLLVAGLLLVSPVYADDLNDPWFARDKALHLGISAGIGATTYGFTRLSSQPQRVRVGIGLGVPLVVGVAKEGWDLTGRGDPSWRDLTADVVGAGLGVGLAWVVEWRWFPPETQVVVGILPGSNYLSVLIIN